MRDDRTGGFLRSAERGSFVVAMVIFIFLFLIIAAMGVDLTRYFYTVEQNQNIADGATLAAADGFKQVRTINNLDRSKVVRAGFRYIGQQKGYDTDAYELSASLKRGDMQSDTFSDPSGGVGGTTVIRIGMNVKYYFEPYFLPRYVFGDEFFTVQSQAVAELRPVYWQSNLYDPFSPGPPVPPLRYSIYSEEDIKPENQDCFVINGDLHANRGYMKTENMNTSGVGDDCRDSSGNNDWGLPNGGDLNYFVNGNIEVGDPSDADAANCGGATPPDGCVVFQDVRGAITGDVYAQDNISMSNGPAVGGTEYPESDEVESVTLPNPPNPNTEPDKYGQPICVFDNAGGTTVTFTNQSDFDNSGVGGNDCSDGGTIYVQNGDSMKLDGLAPGGANEYTFVADGNIQVANLSSGDYDNDKLFFYARGTDGAGNPHPDNGWIKVENLSGDVTLNASFYAPNQGDLTQASLCDPVQPGCVKVETNSGDLTINGSIVAGTLAKIEEQDRFRMNWNGNTDVLPGGLRQYVQKNNIPDYWQVHLIH